MYVTNQLQEVFHPIYNCYTGHGPYPAIHFRPIRMVNTEEGGDLRKGELLHLQT